MKFLFFALFGTGLTLTALNTKLHAAPNLSDSQKYEIVIENPKKPQRYYPKRVCNIDKSSIDDPEKLSIFIAECLITKRDWLLINSSEANYIDEILY